MVSDATLGAAQASIQNRTAFQPNQQQIGAQNGRSQIGEAESNEQTTRVAGTAPAETQESETRNNGQDDASLRIADENSSSVQFTGSEDRGSVIDITV
ncbi:MAG: hypothetical protein AAF569_07255 [Pseudomonadota bacterium]